MIAAPVATAVPFSYLEHLLTVPVTLDDGVEARFVLDTGIGPTLVSRTLAERLGCERDGSTFTGRRMSGQEVAVPLARLGSLTFGGVTAEVPSVGVLDLPGLPEGFDGFLSLTLFDGVPFTVDYPAGAVVVEDEASLAERRALAEAVRVSVERDGPSVTVFLPLVLPDGATASVEVDTGSGVLILDERLAVRLGVALEGDGVERRTGSDETGHEYVRVFTRLQGSIEAAGAPATRQHGPRVMVQRIVHDGLVGDAFLRDFAVTYDLAAGEVLFGGARPTGG